MTIDMRYQSRVDLEIEVQIVLRNRSIHALCKNFSRSGMFLATEAMTIPSGTFIELEFAMDEIKWQIDGLVVRQDEKGIGAIFRMPQPELFTTASSHKKAAGRKTRRKVPAAVNLSGSAQSKILPPGSSADF